MPKDKNPVKESFKKVKEDVDKIHSEIGFLKKQLSQTRSEMVQMLEILKKITKNTEKHYKNNQKPSTHTSTQKPKNPTISTHTSTQKPVFKPLKPQNSGISTGNQGASTDRQTDRQTDTRHINHTQNRETNFFLADQKISEDNHDSTEHSVDDAAQILDSLDSVKKEIRRNFKRLTDQEFSVFTMLYHLDEEEGYADYKGLATRLNLSESSIRDYVGRLIKKGIPVDKKKVNNKQIHLSVSKNLKKITSLPTILQLRDL